MEEIALIMGVANDGHAPPVGQRWPVGLGVQVLIAVRREVVAVVVGVELQVNGQLPQVVHTTDPVCLMFGRGQGGKQERGKNGDDGNDDEEFDQGEASREWRFDA